MTTTDYPRSVPHREVTDRNGRVYRIGESDVDIMGRARTWMVILPWVGMMGISSAEYAFTSAEDTLHEAHLWSSGHVCIVLGTAQFGVLVSGQMGSMPFFLFCSMVSGFGGGAIFPLFAAMTADHFGENNNATNYGMVYSSKLISGLVGSGLGAVVVGAWDYHGAFVLAGSIGLASAVLALFLKSPGRPKARRIVPNPHPLGEEMA